jgi:hypothetical protein
MLTEPSHLFGILRVVSCPLVAIDPPSVVAGSPSSSPWGTEPPPKKARLRAFLSVSSWYVSVSAFLRQLPFLLFLSLNSKSDF